MFVDGVNFVFSIYQIPDLKNEDDEGCIAMRKWIVELMKAKSIIFSDNIEIYGSSAFFGNVETIKYSKNLCRIGNNTIGMINTKSCYIPESIKEIDENAFRECNLIERIIKFFKVFLSFFGIAKF